MSSNGSRSWINPRLWLTVILVGTLGAIAGEIDGHQRASQTGKTRESQANAAAALQLAQATDHALEKERLLARSVANITQQRHQDQTHAQNQITSLRADVRSGAVRLSVATRALAATTPATDASTGEFAETRAELMPAAALALIGIAADGDDAVRDTNACIDQYNAVRDLLNVQAR